MGLPFLILNMSKLSTCIFLLMMFAPFRRFRRGCRELFS